MHTSKKIPNSDKIFQIADSKEINTMSDPELEAIRQQRLAQLQSQYKVNQLCIRNKIFYTIYVCVYVYICASVS